LLDDPICSAAARFIDLVLTRPVDDAARTRLLELLRLRRGDLAERHVNVELARQNAIRLVQAAADEARKKGKASVDLDAVERAWGGLCPRFYPFC
jgi:hypothetical protein